MNAEIARLPQQAESPVLARDRGGLDLPETLLVELTLKHLLRSREATLAVLAERMAVAPTILDGLLGSLRESRAIEVTRRGALDTQVSFTLTDEGARRAAAALALCQYTGPAPVSLAQYRDRMQAQTLSGTSVQAERVRAAFADLVLSESLVDDLGIALNSGRAIFLYGPSGSGKTSLAERMLHALGGSIHIPHALWAGEQIVTLFDPLVHRPVEPSVAGTASPRGLDRAARGDARWVEIARPVVIVGGELTLAALELEYDPLTRVHGAPPQLKANGGLLVIDDLGRQQVSPRDLMNRWIVPLDRRVDYLSLATGVRIEVPFDARVVFSSNLSPDDLADPAFLRRIGYKLYVGALAVADYRQVVHATVARAGATIEESAIDYLVHALHGRDQQPLLPAFPIDLIGKLGDRARYRGAPIETTPDALDWAWQLYFGTGTTRPSGATRDSRSNDVKG